MNYRFGLILGVGLALGACNKPASSTGEATPQPIKPITEAQPGPTPATAPPTAPARPESSNLSFDAVSDSLKNDAFHYYGLLNKNLRTYEIKFSKGPTSHQVVTLTATKLDSDKVEFNEDDAGSPSTTQTMTLDAQGIYVEAIKPQTLKTPHFLELPAKLDPGATWTSHQSVDSGSESLDETLDSKVVGIKDVKVPAGTYKALYIVAAGKGNLGAKAAQMKVESWYVKDVGLVKQVAKISGDGIDSTIQQILIK